MILTLSRSQILLRAQLLARSSYFSFAVWGHHFLLQLVCSLMPVSALFLGAASITRGGIDQARARNSEKPHFETPGSISHLVECIYSVLPTSQLFESNPSLQAGISASHNHNEGRGFATRKCQLD